MPALSTDCRATGLTVPGGAGRRGRLECGRTNLLLCLGWRPFYGSYRYADALVRAAISCRLGLPRLGHGGAFPRQGAARVLAAVLRPFHHHGAVQCADVPVLGGAEPAHPATEPAPRTCGASRQLAGDPRRGAGAVRAGTGQGRGHTQRLGIQLVLPDRMEAVLSEMVRRGAAVGARQLPEDR